MNLTKKQRAELKMKCGGHCAYCGTLLGDRWHADHMEPVERLHRVEYTREPGRYGKVKWKYIPTGMNNPQNDHIGNLWPACIPCNIDKGISTLEQWRLRLQDAPSLLERNYATFKHALRFNRVTAVPHSTPLVFYFERQRTRRRVKIT